MQSDSENTQKLDVSNKNMQILVNVFWFSVSEDPISKNKDVSKRY